MGLRLTADRPIRDASPYPSSLWPAPPPRLAFVPNPCGATAGPIKPLIRFRKLDGENAFDKGEVDSSILSGSAIKINYLRDVWGGDPRSMCA